MAVMKIKLIKAGELQTCGDIWTGEQLEQLAETNIQYKYEPEGETLYAFIETGEQ